MEKNSENNSAYTPAIGRRKEATARIRLFKGKGQSIVNDKTLKEYFPQEVFQIIFRKPFIVTKTQDKYYITAKVVGSGKKSQLDAIVHGIARALASQDKDMRSILKKEGLLTRDPRVKERRKYGLAQKARKRKQSPKR